MSAASKVADGQPRRIASNTDETVVQDVMRSASDGVCGAEGPSNSAVPWQT
jgi:hypothetical protein